MTFVEKFTLLREAAEAIEFFVLKFALIALSMVLIHILALHYRIVIKYSFISITIKVFALTFWFVKLPITLIVAASRPIHTPFTVFHPIFNFSFVNFSLLICDLSLVAFHFFDADTVTGLAGTGVFVDCEGDGLSCLRFLQCLIFVGLHGLTFFADLCIPHDI